MAFEIWKSVQYFGRSQGGPLGPPAGRVTNQTPAGRGLSKQMKKFLFTDITTHPF